MPPGFGTHRDPRVCKGRASALHTRASRCGSSWISAGEAAFGGEALRGDIFGAALHLRSPNYSPKGCQAGMLLAALGSRHYLQHGCCM